MRFFGTQSVDPDQSLPAGRVDQQAADEGPAAAPAAEAAPHSVIARICPAPDDATERGFTGRTDLLAEVEAALRSGEPAVVQAVTGIGGIGKTTTAIEYAHRHRIEFGIAWWVPAENPALLPQWPAELALALDLTTAA
jgi:hypothetical protein